jgi:hypothetical protein
MLLRCYRLAAQDWTNDQCIFDFQFQLATNMHGTPYVKESYMSNVEECRAKLQEDPLSWRGPLWVLGSTLALEQHHAKAAETKQGQKRKKATEEKTTKTKTKGSKRAKLVPVVRTARHYQDMVGGAVNELCRQDWPTTNTVVVEDVMAALERGSQMCETFERANVEDAVQLAREFQARITEWVRLRASSTPDNDTV